MEIPFSGVVRHLTGAYSEDVAHRRAILSGMVRRSYLNGMRHAMKCDQPVAMSPSKAEIPSSVLSVPDSASNGVTETNAEPLPVAGVSSSPVTKNTSG